MPMVNRSLPGNLIHYQRVFMSHTTHTTGSSTIALTPDLFALIDHAGALDTEIKALTKQLDQLKDTIKAQGAGDFAGFMFKAKVVDVAPSEKIDWQTIAQRFNPSYQLIAAHTTQTKATQRINFAKV
jgi:cystathionine beta-lyase family protein involved in aluminum resistance